MPAEAEAATTIAKKIQKLRRRRTTFINLFCACVCIAAAANAGSHTHTQIDFRSALAAQPTPLPPRALFSSNFSVLVFLDEQATRTDVTFSEFQGNLDLE